MYELAADFTLIIHFTFILFVIFGALLFFITTTGRERNRYTIILVMWCEGTWFWAADTCARARYGSLRWLALFCHP